MAWWYGAILFKVGKRERRSNCCNGHATPGCIRRLNFVDEFTTSDGRESRYCEHTWVGWCKFSSEFP